MNQKLEILKGWERQVDRWYAAYSQHEKLLVLHTKEGMKDFIKQLLEAQTKQTQQEEREERVTDCDEAWDYGYEKGKKDILEKLKTSSSDDWKHSFEVAWESIEKAFWRGFDYPKAAKIV